MIRSTTVLEREADARGRQAQREHERQMVAAHYENDAEIFSKILDRRLAYATGIFEHADESLEAAQARKYAWVHDRLKIAPGHAVFDVGCGWGSNLLYLAEHSAGRFRGITLSPRQRAEALSRARAAGVADRVTVDVAHVEDLDLPEASIDAALFVGSIVHMHHRDAIHESIARALRPGGRVLISDCFFPVQARGDRDSSASRYIFETALGYCRLLPLSEELGLLERCGLDVLEVVDLTESYVHTLARWIDAVRAHRAFIDARAPGLSRVLQVYMTIARQTFLRRAALEYMIVVGKAPGRSR